MKTICIYHANCADGFAAAWVVRKAFHGADIEFIPGVYGDFPPDVTDRDVILVDFSYKNEVIREMEKTARSILIIDHHKSAIEDLLGFKPVINYENWTNRLVTLKSGENTPVAVLFDLDRSGAGLVWDFCMPEVRPALIDHIEDRDLWKFVFEGTREIMAAVYSYDYDFDIWDVLMSIPTHKLWSEGVIILRKHDKDVAELVTICKRRQVIGGHYVPVASLPYTLSSDAGHLMAQDEAFAACYWDTEKYRIYSLRSTDNGIDVTQVAEAYGGGGHKHAAGFRVPRDHALARN